jgi:hypothetical protein
VLVTSKNLPQLTLQDTEVSNVLWVDLEYLVNAPREYFALPVHKLSTFVAQKHWIQSCLSMLGLSVVRFPCIYLPHEKASPSKNHEHEAHEFVLWGLTWRITMDLLHRIGATALRPQHHLMLVVLMWCHVLHHRAFARRVALSSCVFFGLFYAMSHS